MARPETAWFPPWVHEVSLPLWITDPHGILSYWNKHAEQLFGRSPVDSIGRPCHTHVGAVDSGGRPFCKRHCEIRMQARARSGFGPYRVKVADSALQWHEMHLIVLALRPPFGSQPWLCHLAMTTRESTALVQYANRVANRSRPACDVGGALASSMLSPREAELLGLLEMDKSLKEAAFDLSISYNTVRSHVKSIRRKLGVHSTHEAIACYLLSCPQRRAVTGTNRLT